MADKPKREHDSGGNKPKPPVDPKTERQQMKDAAKKLFDRKEKGK